ncbi:hypothetical protein MPK66_gp059 [Erwinia phage pEa_SNUABM_2]|uniref:DUF4326 domain-containing protein n=1 Tax=Erwinia phage pEa_SNUABM_2 TaxID=2869547 RepID=A0AAE7XSG1_9CAUD|nr:hypothetical protein MPK66_gp059 [Erwinia phage pEa_SNUABM_2]QZE59303.1 hypothetical protein pEaSNUABM2_00059 [Erwinia phage pEa_SNUABM_2]
MLPLAPKTQVVSMRNGNKNYDVRIDRETKWGNKFYMVKETIAERDRVCDEHEVDLWEKIENGEILLRHLLELYGKRLGCWCSPKRCHGDALARAAEWAYQLNCKYERIKRTYRKRRRANQTRANNIKKKVSRS